MTNAAGMTEKEKHNPKLGPSTFDRKITDACIAGGRGEVRHWTRTLSQEPFAVLTKKCIIDIL